MNHCNPNADHEALSRENPESESASARPPQRRPWTTPVVILPTPVQGDTGKTSPLVPFADSHFALSTHAFQPS
jgi:hypothetical protein